MRFEKCSETFVKPSEQFWKIFGNLRNVVGTSLLVCLNNKQNITCPLVDMNFIFSCSTRYLTRSLRSIVRYRVEHSKINFISTRRHVIFSIYTMVTCDEALYEDIIFSYQPQMNGAMALNFHFKTYPDGFLKHGLNFSYSTLWIGLLLFHLNMTKTCCSSSF